MTILKDKETRESKGVAFVLFLDRQTAQKAVAAVNKKQVFNGHDTLHQAKYFEWPMEVGGSWCYTSCLGGIVANGL